MGNLVEFSRGLLSSQYSSYIGRASCRFRTHLPFRRLPIVFYSFISCFNSNFFIRSTSSRLNNSKIKQCTSGNWVLFASTYATPSHFWHFNRCDFWCRFIPLSSSMFYTRFKLCRSRILIRSIFSFKLYAKAKFSTFMINLLPPLCSVA